MSKATEKALSGLHATIATVLTDQIGNKREMTTFTEDGEEVSTGEWEYTASPATISAAIKFLKDNDITADIETDSNLGNLRTMLDKKQKHSRTGAAAAALLLAERKEG